MSLTRADLAWLATALRALPGSWSVAPVEEPDELFAVLLPEEGDRFAAAFLIDTVAESYRVRAYRWDGVQEVGLFPSLDACLGPVADAAEAGVKGAPFPNLQ